MFHRKFNSFRTCFDTHDSRLILRVSKSVEINWSIVQKMTFWPVCLVINRVFRVFVNCNFIWRSSVSRCFWNICSEFPRKKQKWSNILRIMALKELEVWLRKFFQASNSLKLEHIEAFEIEMGLGLGFQTLKKFLAYCL